MNLTRFAIVLCPLFASINPIQACQAPQAPPMVGSYQPADADSAQVQATATAVQNQLATMRIEEVRAAYIQVVAGTNFKLVCRVSGADGPATWEFVIWHRLDDTWQLETAKRM
jgi:hypothetical protein